MLNTPSLFGKSLSKAHCLLWLLGLVGVLGLVGPAQGIVLTYQSSGTCTAVPDGVIVQLAGNEGSAAISLTQSLPNGKSFIFKGKLPSGTPTDPKLPIVAGSGTFTIGSVTFVDDGSGWVGSNRPEFTQSGTIDYATGSYYLVYPGTAATTQSYVMDGTNRTFSGVLSGTVQPGTVRIQTEELQAIDLPNSDGLTGVFTRDGSTGSIDYVTGSYSGTFCYAPAKNSVLTVNYCYGPPATGTPATVAYKYATGAGRMLPTNMTSGVLEAQWFVTGTTPLANCSNTETRQALQKAIGAAERWSTDHLTDATSLVLPSGTIHFGDRNNRIHIRKGHFSLTGSGTDGTSITPWNGSGTDSANRSVVIDDTASYVGLYNLKFDLQSNHSDFRNSVTSSASNLIIDHCEFGDSQAKTYGQSPATITGVVSNWTSGTSGSGYTAHIKIDYPGIDLVWTATASTDVQIYDPSGGPVAYASVVTSQLPDLWIKTDKLPAALVVGDQLQLYENFTRHALESDGSHVTISNCTFQNTQLRISTGDAPLSEYIDVLNCKFLQSQAYSISCVARSRSNAVDQIRRHINISDNVFTGFYRAAVYAGLDWGTAVQYGTVLDDIKMERNIISLTKAWRGEQVFRFHLGKSNRNLTWKDNTITFTDRPIAAESCLHLINHASGNLRNGLFQHNTIASTVSGAPPSFEHSLWLEATDDFLITGNTIGTPGDLFLWKGAQGVRVEDNEFTYARQILRAENVGRLSLVGNSFKAAPDFSAKMFTLSTTNWNGEDITIANNNIDLTIGGSDLTQITQTNGHLSNVSLLNNNVFSGSASRLIYSGTAQVTYALPGAANWTFDEAFGPTAGDGSINSNLNLHPNDLALKNGASWASDRAALELDGIDGYATMAPSNSVDLVSDFSICAWICPSKTNGYRTILSRAIDNTHCQYALAVDNGMLRFEQKNGTDPDASFAAGTLPVDQWHHVAVTSSASAHAVSLYVDGTAIQTFQNNLAPATSGATLDIGRMGGATPGSYYAGEIDDLQIHSGTTLSQGNIQAIAFGRALGYWRMNETGVVKVADESGLNNSGTLVGSFSWVTPGVGSAGSALKFSGSSAYLDMGHPSNLDVKPPFTVTAWIYPTDTDSKTRTIFSKSGTSPALDLSIKAGQLTFIYGGTLTSPGITNNTWQHVAATVDSLGNANLYCNGEIVQTGTGFLPINTSALSLNIGRRVGSGSATFFMGNIDDVEIYNRALWPDEIRAQTILP